MTALMTTMIASQLLVKILFSALLDKSEDDNSSGNDDNNE